MNSNCESCDYFIGNNIFRVSYLPNGEHAHVGHIINGQYTHRGIRVCHRNQVFDIMLSMFYFIEQIYETNEIDHCLHIGACVCRKREECELIKYIFRGGHISTIPYEFHPQRNAVMTPVGSN